MTKSRAWLATVSCKKGRKKEINHPIVIHQIEKASGRKSIWSTVKIEINIYEIAEKEIVHKNNLKST
jgi:hypothetical protein